MTLKLKDLPDEEFVALGRGGCPGCPAVIGARMASKVLGANSMMVNSTGCMCVNYGYQGACEFPYVHSLFPNAGGILAGMDAGLKALGRREGVNLYAFSGDGGTVDIGFQTLSGAVERGHRFIYICYDNEGYMNTGGQRSGATPFQAVTSTTPRGKARSGQPRPITRRKDMVRIMAAHGIPYAASASIAYPRDYLDKLERAKAVDGPSYIHLHSPCIVGWGYEEHLGVSLAKLAVRTRLFPLYEVIDGWTFRITKEVAKPKPLVDYLELQRRFKHLFTPGGEALIERFQREVNENWDHLQTLAGAASRGL